MLGPGLLVKPVIAEGVTHVTTLLPASSRWYDFTTGREMPPAMGPNYKVEV
eukprot:gene2759-12630_t